MSGKLVTSLEELLASLEMVDVHPYAIEGHRLDEPEAKEDEPSADRELGVQYSRNEQQVVVRLRLPLKTSEARLKVDIGAVYRLNDADLEIPREVMTEFVATVGILAAYPFVREAMYSLALSLRVQPPILGILNPPTPDELIEAQLPRPQEKQPST